MSSHSGHTLLMWDNGLFVSMAATLAKDFGKVYYHSPWEGPFPKDAEVAVGTGLENVTRANDPWKVIADTPKDQLLIVFPDTYAGGLCDLLRGLEYRVWGTGYGEKIENDRLYAKVELAKVGIPIGPYSVHKGITALREHLKTHKDVFVKARHGNMRGNFETFHSPGRYALISSKLDEIEAGLGARKEQTEFLVEKPIRPAVEIGYDGYNVDGIFPSKSCVGIEIKSKGYVGKMVESANLPRQISEVNEAVAPWLKRRSYRNFFAIETRITEDGKPYAIDPCCRAGRPPSELLQVLYTNLADIFWEGGFGKCIDPIAADAWGAEIMIYCERAEKWGAVLEYPDAIAPYVKLVNAARIGGENVVLPGLSGIGAVVATGKTMAAAIKLCQERAEQVVGYDVEMFPHALEDATTEFAKLKKHGVVIE